MEALTKKGQSLEGELFDKDAVAVEGVQDAEEILAALEDSEKSAEDGVDETAAGEEDVQTTDGREANFLARDGDSTDINTDLRDAEFDGAQNLGVEQKIILKTEELAVKSNPNPEPAPDPDLELAPLTLSMEIESSSHFEALAAWEGRGNNSWENNGNLNSAQARVSYTDTKGYGVSNKNQNNGEQDPEMENNESLLFEFGNSTSAGVTINTVDSSIPFAGNWTTYIESGNGYAPVDTGIFESKGDSITVSISSSEFTHIVFNEGNITHPSKNSNSGFYVEINTIDEIPASSTHEYSISFDADYDGSSDLQADLTDITLTGIPTGTAIDGATENGDGSYTVLIDADGKAEVTLSSESSIMDAIDSSISTTDGDMTVTYSQSSNTTLSLLGSGSIDLGDVIDDDSSVELVDIDNSVAQHVEISLDDVLEMRDTTPVAINLEVVGNDGDSVTVNTDSDVHTWNQVGTDFSVGVIYSNDFNDSITLTVDDDIIVYA